MLQRMFSRPSRSEAIRLAVRPASEERKDIFQVGDLPRIVLRTFNGRVTVRVGPIGSVQVVAIVLYFPTLFLSGSAMPREILLDSVLRFAQVFPLTHVVSLLRGVWAGDGLGDHLVAIFVLASVAVSAVTFHRE